MRAVMPDGMARFIEACVQARVNIMIAGGTSTGKTTLMRVLCGMTAPSDHLVVVEDGAELHLDQDRGDGQSLACADHGAVHDPVGARGDGLQVSSRCSTWSATPCASSRTG